MLGIGLINQEIKEEKNTGIGAGESQQKIIVLEILLSINFGEELYFKETTIHVFGVVSAGAD